MLLEGAAEPLPLSLFTTLIGGGTAKPSSSSSIILSSSFDELTLVLSFSTSPLVKRFLAGFSKVFATRF